MLYTANLHMVFNTLASIVIDIGIFQVFHDVEGVGFTTR